MGNLDPASLYSSNVNFNNFYLFYLFQNDELEKIVKKMKSSFKNTKYIANLGHGIYPDTDPEKLKTFVNVLRSD